MAEPQTNGAPAPGVDVEMKEEAPVAANMNNIAEANPPPQLPIVQQPEHLSSIQPPAAAQTPPATSGASARPSSMPPQPSTRPAPDKPVAHGGPTRQYLNSNVTPHLLEGMKYLAVYEPEKPLLWLADFLRDRSNELES